jgi:gamma-glutamylcyclotransferase (GGCT)/AIG2-like uncharacterized protein YtfP
MPVVEPLASHPDNPHLTLRLMLVYGTLKEDEPTHGGAAVPSVRTVRRGLRIPGHLYDVGEYPAATIDHEAVAGERPVTASISCDLVEIMVPVGTTLEATLAAYDAYEDDSYRRVAIALDDPEHASAWIYEWVDDTTDLAPIPSGEWSSRPTGVS